MIAANWSLQIHVKLVFSRNLFCKRMRTRRTLQKCFAFVYEPNSLWNLTWNSLKRFGRNVLFLVGWWLVGWLVGLCVTKMLPQNRANGSHGVPQKSETKRIHMKTFIQNRPKIVPKSFQIGTKIDEQSLKLRPGVPPSGEKTWKSKKERWCLTLPPPWERF